jgi:hypothetical protein
MGKMKKVKKGHTQSRIKKTIQKDKPLRVSQRFNSDYEKLSWQIRLLDFDGPWGWGKMDAKTLKDVHGKLAQFETMTWAEVNHPNTGCHPIKVRDLCNEPQFVVLKQKSLNLKKNSFLYVFLGKNVFGGFENIIFLKYYGGFPGTMCILSVKSIPKLELDDQVCYTPNVQVFGLNLWQIKKSDF